VTGHFQGHAARRFPRARPAPLGWLHWRAVFGTIPGINTDAQLEENNAQSSCNQFDVVVAGAGSAGVAAAVASARAGMKTLLLERDGTPGGNVAGALVHSICGLYLISPDAISRPANGGFAMEFADRLRELGAATGPVRMDRLDVLLQEPAAFSELCIDICRREKNLELACNTDIIEVGGGDSHIDWLRTSTLSEPVSASAFVDATGDAHLSFLAGATCETSPGGMLQRPAYIFSIVDVAANSTDGDSGLEFSRKVVNGIRNGDLDPRLAAAVMRPSVVPGRVRVTIDLDAEGDHYSPLNPECLTRLQILGKKLAFELETYLRTSLAGFEKCRIATLPARIGVRESRRVLGRYKLTGADIVCGAEFRDAVCRSAWPIELRESAEGPRMRYPSEDRPCDVPLRALLSGEIENLLMAGRCISSTHEAQAALRVIGTCLAIGQAAGLAAAQVAGSPERRIEPGGEAPAAAPIRAKTSKGI